MGSGLALAAFEIARERRLGNAATRLLVWMATNADDNQAHPVYFGGADHRAKGMGADTSDRAVRARLAELKDAGVIEQRRGAHVGQNAEYVLCFAAVERRNVQYRQKAEPSVPPVVARGGTSDVERRNLRRREAEPGVPPYPNIPRDPNPAHVYEPNARSALTRIKKERVLPIGVDELLQFAYDLGSGDPWEGFKQVDQLTQATLEGARDPAQVIRARLRKAVEAAA